MKLEIKIDFLELLWIKGELRFEDGLVGICVLEGDKFGRDIWVLLGIY